MTHDEIDHGSVWSRLLELSHFLSFALNLVYCGLERPGVGGGEEVAGRGFTFNIYLDFRLKFEIV